MYYCTMVSFSSTRLCAILLVLNLLCAASVHVHRAEAPFKPWGAKATGAVPASTSSAVSSVFDGIFGLDSDFVPNRDPNVEMISKTDIVRKAEEKCICEVGTYFNIKEQACRKHEDVGFDCSSFPREHHRVLCQDGFTCKGTSPQCTACSKEDNCLSGAVRHNVNCLKENHLSGNACATLRVTVPAVTATGNAKVTETVESEGVADVSSTSSATATHTATETVAASATANGESKESVKVLEHVKSNAQMNVETTSDTGDKSHQIVEGGGIAVAQAKASAEAKAEGSAQRYGTSIATESRDATKTVSMKYKTKVSKSATATGTAEATVVGIGKGSVCVSAADATEIAKAVPLTKEIVVATKIQNFGLRRAYDLALELARKNAFANAKKDAQSAADAKAQKQASDAARAEAKAAADQAAYDKAYKDGQSAVDQKAKDAAKAEAEAKAKAAAEASAKKLAKEKAQSLADDGADQDAKRRASDRAKAIARADASDQAKTEAEKQAYAMASKEAAKVAVEATQNAKEAEKKRNFRDRKKKEEEAYQNKVAKMKEAKAREGKSQKMDGSGDADAIAKISKPGGILRAF
eukprot:TRINITY_DN78737_c0_g1_i1.p1 TRINITY_DN78737_c0_g1~~TRINITY_DN78737_c0_g1_i1.p1  ORF type:complete len:582 (-),score=197.57 TRINITY_DN78737_c0_g1_i1:59-1804(-)